MATGKVWINGVIQSFSGNEYFTGSDSITINLPGRTGYERTWTFSRFTEYFGATTFGVSTLEVPTTSYDVYIHNWYIGLTPYYANTEWRFTKSDKINTHTLTYNADGGTLSGGDYTPQGTYNWNTPITLPTTKTKTGHTFKYFTVGGTETTFFSLTEDKTVVANWDTNVYTLNYTANGGTFGGVYTAQGNHNWNTSITLPSTRTRAGHTFRNFTIDGAATTGFSLTAHTTVVANWDINTYTLSYNADGGTLSGGDYTPQGTYNYNTHITLPLIRTKTGHTFLNFTIDGTETTGFSLTENTTVVANWDINEYLFEYSFINGDVLSYTYGNVYSDAGYYDYGSIITLPIVSRTGYTFQNFIITLRATEGSTTTISSSTRGGGGSTYTVPAYHMTLTPNFAVDTYAVNYMSNVGDIFDEEDTYTEAGQYPFGTTINLPSVSKIGHTFQHFDVTIRNSGGTVTTDTTTDSVYSVPEANLRFTAIFTINTYTYNFTSNVGDMLGGPFTSPGYYDYGTGIVLPIMSRTGYTFINFTIDEIRISGNSLSLPAKNTEVVSNWNINEYLVFYLSITPPHFNFTPSSGIYDFNTLLTATIINIDPPRVIGEVYSFDKWTYNGYDLGTTRLPTDNINLQANWNSSNKDEIQINELSIVFDNFQIDYYENIRISNYFDQLQLSSPSDKKDVKFSTKLKGKGTF